MELGRYNLTDVSSIDQPITPALWPSKVKPGTTIAMNIVLQRLAREDMTKSCHCPACDFFCRWTSLGDEVTWYSAISLLKQCPTESFLPPLASTGCGTLFHVSNSFIEETQDPEENEDPVLKNSLEVTGPSPMAGMSA